jgi:hypothetical protein
MKKCCECKINKELKDFAKNKNIKDGLNNRCKICCKNRNKNRYEKEKDKIKNQTKEYYIVNKEYILQKQKEKPSYHKLNQEYYKEWREKNRKKYKEYISSYQKLNQTKKYHTDAKYKTKKILDNQIRAFLKGTKNTKTKELLGYNYDEFINKIGTPKINEHIDHKIPKTWFKENTPINIIWGLDNLQIVSSNYNKRKYNTFCDNVCKEYKDIVKEYIKEEYINKI